MPTSNRTSQQALREEIPAIQQLKAKIESEPQRLRPEYGVYINYVSPIQAAGGRAWAIGERLYPNRPAEETFHEFLIHVLRGELGRPWAEEQAALPDEKQHFLFRASNEYRKWKAESLATATKEREGL
jgi:hypothetical protein